MEPDAAEDQGKPARVVFLALLLAALVLFAAVVLPIWRPLVVAAVLAGGLMGPYRRLRAKLGGRKHLAASGMTIAVLVLILIPLSALVTFAILEGIDAARAVSELLRAENGLERLIRRLPDGIEAWVQRVRELLPSDADALQSGAAASGRWAATTLAGLVGKFSSILLSLTFMLIAFFFFLADGPELVTWIASALPIEPDTTDELLHEFRDMSRVVLGASLATGGAQASLATIAYFIAPVPNPLFFGLLTFVTSFIPTVGTAIVSLPLSAFLVLTGKPWWGVFLVAWSLGLVALVDNLMRPWLMGGRARIHGALLFFSLIGGISLFGPVGLLVGPLSVTFLLTMQRLWRRDFDPKRFGAPRQAPPPELLSEPPPVPPRPHAPLPRPAPD